VNSHEKAIAAAQAALEKKAYDLVVLEVAHLSSIADYFLIATGRSDVQVQAIARGISERMDRDNERPIAIEGFNHGHWVVLDYVDVVVHIFFEPVREFYRLENNWPTGAKWTCRNPTDRRRAISPCVPWANCTNYSSIVH